MNVRDRPLRGKDEPASGTDAGFQRHWRANEAPCDPCAAAHRVHVAQGQKAKPESHREANRRWRSANPGYFAEWRTSNPEYGSWAAMIKRCTEPSHVGYANYGGRGIRVCAQWLDSFETFLADMGPKPTPDYYSIDRIDNDGGYEPSNCRWATREQQRANRRDCCFVRAAVENSP